MKILFTIGFLVMTAHASARKESGPTGASNVNTAKNSIPPRLQWEANFGYCGEVGTISAGLYYGQYVSQYDARAVASKDTPQSKEGSQLLIGVNDKYAAEQLHLNAVQWSSDDKDNANDFLAWVKGNVVSGYPVIIGVYENHSAFDETDDENAGEEEYDHIVLVNGVSSKHALSQPPTYYDDDVITFSDHGLWSPSGHPQYIYNYKFGSFQKNRKGANSESGPIYSLARGPQSYGFAITGIIDQDHVTLPVRLTTNVNYEKPAMVEGSNTRPKSQSLTLTITISGLKPGVSYNLYRYNNLQKVPNSAFNAKASDAHKKWDIKIEKGSTYSMTEKISSDEIAVYRAVPGNSP